MQTVILHDLLENHNYVQSGNIVFEMAKDAVSRDEIIIIDMTDVESVPTNFLNTSLGALMDMYGVEKTKKSFKFRNILKTQVERIIKYFNDYEALLTTC
ncbi:hypothetical protein GGR21_002458 [Dysgonomonas hofstadii]|uniref:DUF4325 domain-containing protein n=1 Tax=Dysgonomonas hofstadii TaxID=637886 RepID=A0A840CVP7_9BACT|nr:STAS-like domain-containing protein [Dysgonomonas hofstadii]MBB4036552.1 hypothetical protein [Dysgonomonas hofstadii]